MATTPPTSTGNDESSLQQEATQAETEQQPNKAQSSIAGLADTATFGFADEALAGIESIDPTAPRSAWQTGSSISDAVTNNLARIRGEQAKAQQAHPGYYLGGQIAGGFTPGAGLFGEGRTFGSFVQASARSGFAYGVGSGEGVGDRLTQGVEDAVIGAAASPVLYPLTRGLAAGARWIGGKVSGLLGAGEHLEVDAAGNPTGNTQSDALIQTQSVDAPIPEGRSKVVGWGTDPNGNRYPILADAAPESAGRTDAAAGKPPAGATKAQASNEGATAKPETLSAETPAGEDPANPIHALKQEMDGWLAKIHEGGQEAANMPADSPQGQLTLGNLGSPDETIALQRSILDQLPPKEVRSDDDLLKTVAQGAAEMGQDPETIAAVAQQLGKSDEGIALLRTTWNAATNEVNNLHLANIDWTTAEPELMTSAGEAIRNLSVLSQQFSLAKQGLGRGLRALQLPDAATYAKSIRDAAGTGNGGPALDDAEEGISGLLPTTPQEMKDWFDLWGMIKGDPKQEAAFLEGKLTVPSGSFYLRQSFANLFTANVLSRPKTVLLNVVGPTFINGIRSLERATGAAVSSLQPGLSDADRAAFRVTAREAALAPLRMLGDVGDAFQMGLKAAEQNHTIIGGGGQTIDTQAQFGPITPNLLERANVDPNWQYSLGNLINIFPKAFARINNGLDEAAKRITYQSEVRIHALADAASQGLSGQDVADFAGKKMADAYDQVGRATDHDMLASAERTTLTSTVGEEGSFARKTAQYIQTLRADYPEMRFILPVFNVPVNALGETLRRLPIAGIPHVNEALGFSRTAADLAGENGIVAQADAHGRLMLGSAFLGAGLLMNRLGLMTGAGPQDKTDRAVWLQTHQPYSIRLGGSPIEGGTRDGQYEGGEWVSYNKFDILGGLLSIPATVSDATTNHSLDKSMGDLSMAAAGSLAQWFLDRGSLRTAAGIFALGTDPTNAAQGIPRMMDSIRAGMIPGSGALSTTVDVTDPYVRQRNSWEDYLKTSIPGWSNTVEPVRNVLGEPVNRAADTYPEAMLPVTYSSANSFKKDEVLDELDRIYQVSGYGAGADVQSWGQGFFNPKAVKLEDGKSLFDHAMKARQTVTVDGQTLRQSLLDLFHSDEYANAVDSRRAIKETLLGDPSREGMVARVFQKFNRAIKANLAEASPIADRYLTAAAVKAHADTSLDGTTADDLAGNPDLYTAHGIDARGYSDKIKDGSSGALLDALSIDD